MREKRRGIKDIYRKESGVYKMSNCITNDFYIGSSRNIYNRYYSHIDRIKTNDHDNSKIRSHSVLHGVKSFIFEVLEYCDESIMHAREQYYCDLLKPTYNAWANVLSPKGFKHSSESIEKSSSKRKGFKMSEEQKQKLREAWKLRRLRPDGVEALRMLNRSGKKHSEETINLFKLQRKGKPKSPETRKKMSEARLGWKYINGQWIKGDS